MQSFKQITEHKKEPNDFDQKKHLQLLYRSGGEYKYGEEFELKDNQTYFDITDREHAKKCIFISKVISPGKGGGFGTAVMRDAVSESLKRGLGGSVQLDSVWSSHLFYLYMGMVPIEYDKNDLGVVGFAALKYLEEHNQLHDFSDDKPHVKHLKYLLSHLLDGNHHAYGAQDILDHREQLLALRKEKHSFIRESFIPRLLCCLNTTDEYPDTSMLNSVMMTLSDAGKARWTYAIQNDKAFTPFKNLEHFQPYMTDAQKKQLQEILQKRAQCEKVHAAKKLEWQLRESYQEKMAQFDQYLKRRQQETKGKIMSFFFGYSQNDYAIRKAVYDSLQSPTIDLARREEIIQTALQDKHITAGHRHQCADILQSLKKDISQLHQIESERKNSLSTITATR